MWNLIKLSIIGCCFLQLFSTSSACTTCEYGFVVLDPTSSNPSIRFEDNTTEALNIRTTLLGVNFLSTNASDACTTHSPCGTVGVCTVLSQYLFNCSCANASYEASSGPTLFSCNDVDECSNATLNNCHANATCNNTSPGYFCTCDPGFMGDGVANCTDIQECSPNRCGVNANCSEPVINNYTCSCYSGYTGDPYANCTEIDECMDGTDDCHDNATCQNTNGGFLCSCIPGFTGNGTYCEDINECAFVNCTVNATCSEPVVDNYTCTCDPGFAGDGMTSCTDNNECASGPCGLHATCTEPFANNYTCTCDTYYTGDPYNSNCTDLDECSTNSSDCSVNANCTNTDPGFNCTCKSGFTGNGTDCQDIDECLNSTCHVNATCTNTPGSFYCTCRTGYTGDGVTSCTLDPKDIAITFLITCEKLPFNSTLQDNSSVPYYNLTTALKAEISAFITRVDPSGIFAGASFSIRNSTDGYGDAQAEITLSINNTILQQDDFLREVSTITETTQCGAVASADECSLGTDNCPSGTTCDNTAYGFCCYQDIDFRAALTDNSTYNSSIHTNLSLADSLQKCNGMKSIAISILDTKQIRGCSQSITAVCERLLSGSVQAVYQFSIINATFTVTDLINELQKAVNETTSYGSTITAAGDFDECSADYEADRNCSAFARCLNYAGSFTCECNDTHYDNNGTAPGQLCINPVTVNCNSSSNISVSLLSNFYTNHAVNITDLHLADHNCNYSTHAKVIGDSVEFTVAVNDCNTNVTLSSDNSTVIASNYISNLPSTGVFTGKEFIVPFQCEFPASLNVSAFFNGVVHQVSLPSVASVGGFTLVFNMYDSPSFSNVVVGPISSSLTVYGQISILNDITGVSVSMDRCWGTPTSNPDDPEFHEFITNGCSNGNAVNFTLYSNGAGSAQFGLQMFFFTQVNAVYMHCEVQVCTPSCISNCPARRRRRQAVEKTGEVTITIQLKLDPNDLQFNNKSVKIINDPTSVSGSTVHDITLPIVSAILAFVLIVLLALLVIVAVRKNRASKDSYDTTHVNMHAFGVKPPEY